MTQHKRRDFLKLVGLGGLGVGLAAKGFVPLLSGAHAATAKGDLILRTIPASGEQIPAVGLGTARTFDVGSVTSMNADQRAQLRDVMQTFHEHGGRLVDTSPMYGTSEELIGMLCEDLGITDEMFMATKVWTTGRDAGIAQMERSMELLHTEPMHMMQIHNLVDWRTHYKTLRDWQEQGRVRYVGITHYRSDMHAEVEQVLNSERFDTLQINYSVLDRNAEKRLLPLAQDKGIAVLINEPFEKGTLFGKTRGQDLPDWAAEFDAESWAQVFLKFILGHPAVTCPIPATSKAKHVADNVGAAYGRLPDEAMRKRIVSYMEGL